jgi:hypothetical protein
MLVALAVCVFAAGGTVHAQGGPGGGGGGGRLRGGGGGVVPFGDVVGTWFSLITPIGSTITFQVLVTFTAANGQFTNGQFTCEKTNPLTGQVTTVQGTYTVDPLPGTGTTGLTMVSRGEIVFQGLYAQPGPGEFIIETFSDWPLVGGPDFFSFFRQ